MGWLAKLATRFIGAQCSHCLRRDIANRRGEWVRGWDVRSKDEFRDFGFKCFVCGHIKWDSAQEEE